MDAKVLDKLYKIGAVERLPDGQDGVRVSLQYQARMTNPSRSQRRDSLKQTFENIAKTLACDGAEVYLDSLSVSAQTVEAILPVAKYDEIASRLSDQNIRVDLNMDRQVL